jgi:hypothetical protein
MEDMDLRASISQITEGMKIGASFKLFRKERYSK